MKAVLLAGTRWFGRVCIEERWKVYEREPKETKTIRYGKADQGDVIIHVLKRTDSRVKRFTDGD